MLKYEKIILLVLSFSIILFSCNKNKKDKEQALLSEYLESHNIKTEPVNGVYVIETGFSASGANNARKPVKGDTVIVMYKGYLLADSSLVFDQRPYNNPFYYVYITDKVLPGWETAIGLMRENIPAKIIIPSGMAYKGNQAGIIPPYSTLIFDAKILKIKKP